MFVNPCSILFWVLFLISILSLLIGFGYVLQVFRSRDYRHVGTPAQLQKYYSELIEYKKKVKEAQNIEINIDVKFEESLEKVYVDSAEFNDSVNVDRSDLLYKAKEFIVFSTVLLVFSFPVYWACKPDDSIQKIMIVKNSEVTVDGGTRSKGQFGRFFKSKKFAPPTPPGTHATPNKTN